MVKTYLCDTFNMKNIDTSTLNYRFQCLHEGKLSSELNLIFVYFSP